MNTAQLNISHFASPYSRSLTFSVRYLTEQAMIYSDIITPYLALPNCSRTWSPQEEIGTHNFPTFEFPTSPPKLWDTSYGYYDYPFHIYVHNYYNIITDIEIKSFT